MTWQSVYYAKLHINHSATKSGAASNKASAINTTKYRALCLSYLISGCRTLRTKDNKHLKPTGQWTNPADWQTYNYSYWRHCRNHVLVALTVYYVVACLNTFDNELYTKMDVVLLSSIFRHADLCCGPRNNNNISTTVFTVLSSCMVYLSNADSAPGGHQPSNLPSPSIWAVHLPFIITSRHAALRRDRLYQPTRPSAPLSHAHGVTLRCDFG